MLKDNIRVLRRDRQMTQKDLAAILSVTQQAVAKWEKGIAEPDSSALCALADYFNVSVDFLLGRSPAQPDIKNAPVVLDEGKKELLRYYERLSDQGRELLLAQAKLLLQQGFGEKAEADMAG